METVMPDVVALSTMAATFLGMFLLLRRRQVGGALLLCAGITLVGWFLSVWAVDRAVPVVQQQMNANAAARGVSLTLEEGMYDGVGDRIAAFCTGWMFGAMGAAAGAVASLLTWIRRRRTAPGGFPVHLSHR